jgi:hypothetical protein
MSPYIVYILCGLLICVGSTATAVYCAHTYTYTALLSRLQGCYTVLPQPHISTAVADIVYYTYTYIYTCRFHKNRFRLANLTSSVCPSPLVQMFDRLLRSTPAHQGTRLRSTREYTRAQAPRCDGRAPAVSRRHGTARHPRLTPTPQSSVPPPPPLSSCACSVGSH